MGYGLGMGFVMDPTPVDFGIPPGLISKASQILTAGGSDHRKFLKNEKAPLFSQTPIYVQFVRYANDWECSRLRAQIEAQWIGNLYRKVWACDDMTWLLSQTQNHTVWFEDPGTQNHRVCFGGMVWGYGFWRVQYGFQYKCGRNHEKNANGPIIKPINIKNE